MLVFSMFIFLSLALVKRYTELREARKKSKTSQIRGRGYLPDDLEMIAALGAASGYLSVMVLALYIQDAATAALYRHPQLIWLACSLLLFWTSRTWLLAQSAEPGYSRIAVKYRTIPLFLQSRIGPAYLLVFYSAPCSGLRYERRSTIILGGAIWCILKCFMPVIGVAMCSARFPDWFKTTARHCRLATAEVTAIVVWRHPIMCCTCARWTVLSLRIGKRAS